MFRTIATLAFLALGALGAAQAQTAALPPIVSTAAESSHVLKTSFGALYDLQVTTGASAGFILIYDLTAAPANGAVTPKKCYQIAAASTVALFWTDSPVQFTNGIVAAFSTGADCFNQTLSATAYFSGEIR